MRRSRRNRQQTEAESVDPDEFFDGPRKSRLRRNLLVWFDQHQRKLPWRHHNSRYHIWVSEIMLQQTQVATVIDYYRRFVKAFPDIQRLAAADEQDVLKIWEGLGYYRRARQMLAAARVIVEQFGGRFPSEFDSVIGLPGIGRYTAGAILSIADNRVFPVLEGNTQRLFARLLDWHDPVQSGFSQARLWEFSEEILSHKRPGDFNQAAMELGALVCKPSQPDCKNCPLKSMCLSRIRGTQQKLPVKNGSTRIEKVNEAIVLWHYRQKVLLRKADDAGRWAGMWDFPRYRLSTSRPLSELQQHFRRQVGPVLELSKLNFSLNHSVTRFRIQLDCYRPDQATKPPPDLPQAFRWHPTRTLDRLALNVTARRIVEECLSPC